MDNKVNEVSGVMVRIVSCLIIIVAIAGSKVGASDDVLATYSTVDFRVDILRREGELVVRDSLNYQVSSHFDDNFGEFSALNMGQNDSCLIYFKVEYFPICIPKNWEMHKKWVVDNIAFEYIADSENYPLYGKPMKARIVRAYSPKNEDTWVDIIYSDKAGILAMPVMLFDCFFCREGTEATPYARYLYLASERGLGPWSLQRSNE